VSPSKTAIVPINPSFMPRDGGEVERCSRTVYVNQIDRQVSDHTVRQMFQNFCGKWWGGTRRATGWGRAALSRAAPHRCLAARLDERCLRAVRRNVSGTASAHAALRLFLPCHLSCPTIPFSAARSRR